MAAMREGAESDPLASGWLSDETAMRLLFKFAGEEVDVHSELERVKATSSTNPGS